MPRPGNQVSHAREAFYIVWILILLLVGVVSIAGPGGYLELKWVEEKLENQKAKVQALREDTEERMRRVNLMTDDIDTIESYVRKNNYGKKGEIVQEVPLPRKEELPAPLLPAGKK